MLSKRRYSLKVSVTSKLELLVKLWSIRVLLVAVICGVSGHFHPWGSLCLLLGLSCHSDRYVVGGTDGCRKNRSTLNLKPLKLLVFIKSTNLIGYGALSKILLHQFTKPPRRPRRGGRQLVLHFINMLLDSLCRRTLRKGLSSVRNAKRCSAPPSLYSVIFSSTIVSITIYVSIRLLKHCWHRNPLSGMIVVDKSATIQLKLLKTAPVHIHEYSNMTSSYISWLIVISCSGNTVTPTGFCSGFFELHVFSL